MTDIFLGFLNRSLAAGILILAVVLVRLVFKKGSAVAAVRAVGAGGGAAGVPGVD